MAALRYAARKLCERISLGRRSMASISSTEHAGLHDELKLQTWQKKEELYRLLELVHNKRVYPSFSMESIHNYRLATQLAAQVLPKYGETLWGAYRVQRALIDTSIVCVLAKYYYGEFSQSDGKEDDTMETNKKSEANVPYDGEPKTETT